MKSVPFIFPEVLIREGQLQFLIFQPHIISISRARIVMQNDHQSLESYLPKHILQNGGFRVASVCPVHIKIECQKLLCYYLTERRRGQSK